MAFECSYAGVPLCVPTPEVQAWVDDMIPTLDLRDVQPPHRWPGKNLVGLAWENPTSYPKPRLGQLFWPCGASRWAIGHFLADGAMVRQIASVAAASYTAANLVLNAGSSSITARMYCLPPRPLAGLGPDVYGNADLYLLTLVDVRYFWQWSAVTNHAGTAETPQTWEALFSVLAGVLGIDLSPGSVSSAYGKVEPDSALFTNEENAALVLDAALRNTGRVLAANYDGTFTVQTMSAAHAETKAQRNASRVAGGAPLKLDTTAADDWRKAVLPTSVEVTFPKWVNNEGYETPTPQYRGWILDSYNAVCQVVINLGALPGYTAFVNNARPWMKVFHDTAKARYAADAGSGSGTATPDNLADLTALATQLATDFADGLLARIDEVYPGVLPWVPDGVNDVLVCYQSGTALTRVQGRPWNSGVQEMQHGFGPLPNIGDADDNSFLAWLTASPVGSEAASCGSISGSGFVAGYGWQEIVLDVHGQPTRPFGLREGTPCVYPAYERNGLIVPLTTNGHATIVRMWPSTYNELGEVATYEFGWPLDECDLTDIPSGFEAVGKSNEIQFEQYYLVDGVCHKRTVLIRLPTTVLACVFKKDE